MYHALLERGVYMGPSGYEVGFISAAHTESVLKDAQKVMIECLDIAFSAD